MNRTTVVRALRLSLLVSTFAVLQTSDQAHGQAGGDEPNLALEKRLYSIFSKTEPISSDRWSEMIGSRKEDVYPVQSGDTLWDISKTLFGDGFFWSKLWAENGTLENPHQISKGKGIRFVAGTEDAAPSVDVVSEKAVEMIKINALRETKGSAPTYREQALKDLSPEELMNQNAVEIEELIPQPEIPPVQRERRAVLEELPASFKSVQPRENHRYDGTGLDAGRDKSRTSVTSMNLESYLLDSAPKSVGTIEEIEVGEAVASIGQNVFVKLMSSARPGDKFTVIYPKSKIDDPIRGSVGPIIEVGGTIQVIASVDERKNVYRANVMQAVNPIRKGSLLTQEVLPKVTFVRRGTRLNTEVRIIGGEYDPARKLLGESSVVYLDGGQRAGLSPGDILSVLARRGSRRKNTEFPDWRRPIGLLKVVRVEPTVATAVILEAQEEIVPGDRTGGALPEPAIPIRDHEAATALEE